jgi:hypothetical protein
MHKDEFVSYALFGLLVKLRKERKWKGNKSTALVMVILFPVFAMVILLDFILVEKDTCGKPRLIYENQWPMPI